MRVEARAKDTRVRMIERFKAGVYVFPGARFQLTAEEMAIAAAERCPGSVDGETGTGEDADPDAGDDTGDDGLSADDGDDEEFGVGPENSPDDAALRAAAD